MVILNIEKIIKPEMYPGQPGPKGITLLHLCKMPVMGIWYNCIWHIAQCNSFQFFKVQ